jgi:hypothetical protein
MFFLYLNLIDLSINIDLVISPRWILMIYQGEKV